MLQGKVAGQGGFGAEGLGIEHRRYIWVVLQFQPVVRRGLVLHAAGPAIDMGRIRKELQQAEISGRYSPEAGGRFAGLRSFARLNRPFHSCGDLLELFNKAYAALAKRCSEAGDSGKPRPGK